MSERLRGNWIDTLRRLAPLLPAELFGRLRGFTEPEALPEESGRAFADSLQEAISSLDSFHHTLTTFLPRYLLDLAPTPGEPSGEVFEGSFIFADVTGFTALTGELSKRGTAGREEMNRLMRSLFAAILDPLLASGGDLLFFAGDAALACFPAQPDGQDAVWATRTALRLVRAIIPFASFETPYGSFSLTMSAGVERGLAYAAVVGTKKRMDLLISGGPVQGATAAEGEGEPGQVVAGPGVMPFLSPDEFKLKERIVEGVHGKLDDYESIPPTRRRSRLSAMFSRRIPDLLEHLEQTLSQVEKLVPFIPLDLLTQIARGEDIRQHPPVAIQFVNLMGLEDLALTRGQPELATAAFQRYFIQAQEIVSSREGIISQVDPYAKGFTLLNPFGAPTHHEGVPRLAASTALELAHALEGVNREFELDPPLTHRVGMTYDRIFTGEIGYRHRREYVVAGPAVNLAARLMSKAEAGQIVVDPVMWNEIKDDFSSDELAAIPLKGIPDPVPRFALRGIRQGKGLNLTNYPLIGRADELSTLEAGLDQAAAGQGGTWAVMGEAGIGKSRLAVALAESARERDMAVMVGTCRPFGETTPYLPWADLVGQYLGLDQDKPPDTRRKELRSSLERYELSSSFPAFADLVGLPPAQAATIPTQRQPSKTAGASLFAAVQQQTEKQSSDVSGLAALLSQRVAAAESQRSDNDDAPSIWTALRERAYIPRALQLLLEKQAHLQPTLVILEDVHWMDADSQHVLAAVAEAAPGWPLFLMVTTRPDTTLEWERTELTPLSKDENSALAAVALQSTALEPELADWIWERASGNPLFCLSYCRALQEDGAVVVDPASDQAHWSGPPPDLPISLQELLLAQVERLGAEAREAARRGAVIGSTFSTQMLAHMLEDSFASSLDRTLGTIARHALIAPPPPFNTHTFSSQSLHDAIYATLSHAQRQEWHEHVGDLLRADHDLRYERLEQIAYHYSRSGDAYKATRFTRLAGDKARARQADESALSFYSQTLAVDQTGDDISAEQSRAHAGIGDVHALAGSAQDASKAYQTALKLAADDDRHTIEAKLALLAPLQDRTDPGSLEAVRKTLDRSDPLLPWLAAAQVWACAERNETESAVQICGDLLPAVAGPAKELLQEAQGKLEQGKPLVPYADLYALFASSQLRLPPGGEL